MIIDPNKKPEIMTSAELEKAIREHQEYVRKLIEEATLRRLRDKDIQQGGDNLGKGNTG